MTTEAARDRLAWLAEATAVSAAHACTPADATVAGGLALRTVLQPLLASGLVRTRARRPSIG